VPDWTYHPLRRPMGALLGEARSRRAALGLIAALARLPGGRWLVAGLGHTTPPPEARGEVLGIPCAARVGASVGLGAFRDALSALPALGAGLLEVGPVSPGSLEKVQRVLDRARVPVVLRVGARDAEEVASAIGSRTSFLTIDISDSASGLDVLRRVQGLASVPVMAAIDAGLVESLSADVPVLIRGAAPADVVKAGATRRTVLATTLNASPESAADLIAAGAAAVLATPAALIESGPGWFQRATMAYLARARPGKAAEREGALQWMAGVALGLGMIAGGVGAAAVALGPVLLAYDQTFLGVPSSDLAALNPRLIHFLQHDRITLAGTMIAIGILYSALSWWGIREGRAWARDALLASGLVGFPTLFYFLFYQYVEPIHVALAAVLFPLFVLAVWRRPHGIAQVVEGEGPMDERRRALVGQLLMVATGAGLIIGGLTVSYVGLTSVFVPSDLNYMSTSAHALAASNHRLLSFIAHDRAGFGGALISVGVAVLLLSSWGWARSQAWVWWSLAAAATVGFGAALVVHFGVGYTDFWHLAPIYAGSAVTVIGLAFGRSFLVATSKTLVDPRVVGIVSIHEAKQDDLRS